MPLVHVRHTVPVVHRRPRARMPSIAYVDAVTPIEIPVADTESYQAVTDNAFLRQGIYEANRIESGRILTTGPGGLWSVLWVDPEEATRGRSVRAATPDEGRGLLEGAPGPFARDRTSLLETPVAAVPADGGGRALPEPDAGHLADVGARLVRWVGRNMHIRREAIHLRIGVPAINMLHWPEVVHPSGADIGAYVINCPLSDVRRTGVPARVGERLRTLVVQAAGRFTDRDAKVIDDAAFAIMARFPEAAACMDPVGHFANAACHQVFEIAAGSGSRRASAEAPAIKERLDAALVELAPWAGLGRLGLIEPEEWGPAIERALEAARLLNRSFPWFQQGTRLEAMLAYAEEVALPLLAERDGEIDDLSALAPAGAAQSPGEIDAKPSAEMIDVTGIIGAFVFDAAGKRIGRVSRLFISTDGRTGDIILKVNTREVAVPFEAFRFGRGGYLDRELTLLMERPELEGWIVRRRPVPAKPE